MVDLFDRTDFETTKMWKNSIEKMIGELEEWKKAVEIAIKKLEDLFAYDFSEISKDLLEQVLKIEEEPEG